MPLPAILAGKTAGELFRKIGLPLILALTVAAILLLTFCEGKRSGGMEADNARLKANAGMLKKKGAADDAAAAARTEGALRQTQEQRELEEATANATDPNERRRAFHRCLRVQQHARATGRSAPQCD
jgi:hypothetical protein